MHVVHPNPTSENPSLSRYGVSPAASRYSVTTREPGASDVFTHGFVSSPASTAFFASRPAATITDGFEVFVQLVIAAMTTEPWRTTPWSSGTGSGRRTASTVRSVDARRPAVAVCRPRRGSRDTCSARDRARAGRGTPRRTRPTRRRARRGPAAASVPRREGTTDDRSSSSDLAERRLGVAVAAEQPLLLRVALDEVDAVLASRERRYRSVSSSTGKNADVAPYSGHMFDSVARSASSRVDRPSPKNSTNLPTTPCARSIWVSVSTRSVAVVPAGSAPGDADADDHGRRQEHRLAEHRRLGLDPADAPAEDAEPVDHRRVRVRADERVGHRDAVLHRDDLAEVLEVHLVADPGTRRHDAHPVERLLGPAQQRVPLAVAPVLPLDVGLVRGRRPEQVHLDRVVDHEVDVDERIHPRRVAAGASHRRAHRGEVDHRRHAGEVLHQHAGGHEREVRPRDRAPATPRASERRHRRRRASRLGAGGSRGGSGRCAAADRRRRCPARQASPADAARPDPSAVSSRPLAPASSRAHPSPSPAPPSTMPSRTGLRIGSDVRVLVLRWVGRSAAAGSACGPAPLRSIASRWASRVCRRIFASRWRRRSSASVGDRAAGPAEACRRRRARRTRGTRSRCAAAPRRSRPRPRRERRPRATWFRRRSRTPCTVTRSPTWTGCRNDISSIETVTHIPPACLIAAMPAAVSTSFITSPPCTIPATFACVISISWTRTVCESAPCFGVSLLETTTRGFYARAIGVPGTGAMMTTMRRLTVAFILAAALAACDEGGTTTPTAPPSPSATTGPSETATPEPTLTTSPEPSPSPRPIPPAWAAPIDEDLAPEALPDDALVPPDAQLTDRLTLPAASGILDGVAVSYVVGADPFAAEHGFALWQRFDEAPAWSVVFAFVDPPREGILGIRLEAGDLHRRRAPGGSRLRGPGRDGRVRDLARDRPGPGRAATEVFRRTHLRHADPDRRRRPGGPRGGLRAWRPSLLPERVPPFHPALERVALPPDRLAGRAGSA